MFWLGSIEVVIRKFVKESLRFVCIKLVKLCGIYKVKKWKKKKKINKK